MTSLQQDDETNIDEDYPTIMYGLNLGALIFTAPLWVPFWILGVIAKKLRIKP